MTVNLIGQSDCIGSDKSTFASVIKYLAWEQKVEARKIKVKSRFNSVLKKVNSYKRTYKHSWLMSKLDRCSHFLTNPEQYNKNADNPFMEIRRVLKTGNSASNEIIYLAIYKYLINNDIQISTNKEETFKKIKSNSKYEILNL